MQKRFWLILTMIFYQASQKRSQPFFNGHHNQIRSLATNLKDKQTKSTVSPKETILTNHEFVPPYIDEMIQKYQNKNDKNIFFVITPINKNIFHGDINHSNINAQAGGKGNKAASFQNNIGTGSANNKKELDKINSKLDQLKKQNEKLIQITSKG